MGFFGKPKEKKESWECEKHYYQKIKGETCVEGCKYCTSTNLTHNYVPEWKNYTAESIKKICTKCGDSYMEW
jgi:hypothetical protein